VTGLIVIFGGKLARFVFPEGEVGAVITGPADSFNDYKLL
jgi:hypothetical protein